jgi:hypothetical protein
VPPTKQDNAKVLSSDDYWRTQMIVDLERQLDRPVLPDVRGVQRHVHRRHVLSDCLFGASCAVRHPEKDSYVSTDNNRRHFLHRAAAATAGLAVVSRSTGAHAATGDPIVAGSTTASSSGDVTELVGDALRRAVFVVSNLATAAVAQPILKLRSATAANPVDPSTGDRGDLAISDHHHLQFAHTGPATGHKLTSWGKVYTSFFANFLRFEESPIRAVDTRAGTGAPARMLGAGSEIVVDLAHIEDRAIAVVGNLTVTGPEGSGFLSVYADQRSNPMTSALNFQSGETVANFAIIRLSAGSKFKIFSSVSAHVVFDVTGFVVSDST